MFKAVLFDLDGTLLDTAPDLTASVNVLRAARGEAPMAVHALREQASNGARGMLEAGLQISESHPDYPDYREQFLEYYEANIAVHTTPFPGVPELIECIEKAPLPWGIVTNKPTYLTEKVLKAFPCFDGAHIVVCGDTLAVSKPDPAPLFHSAKAIAVAPEHCLYVGDAPRDIEAARRANMCAVAARYGYFSQVNPPEAWQAHHIIDEPLALLGLLG